MEQLFVKTEGSGKADRLISRVELAQRLGVSLTTIKRWRAKGKLPQPVQIGAYYRWREGEVVALIKRLKAEAKAAA